jgi:hypothetical protein
MFWVTTVLGLLLGLAPFVLGFASVPAALWTDLVLGLLIAVLSLIGALSPEADNRWMRWVIGLSGVAAILAPLIFGYARVGGALWTGIILGVILIVIELFSGSESPNTAPAH